MKKILVAILLMISSTVYADSINGRLGITAKTGIFISSDNGISVGDQKAGFTYGGGLIYGLTDHVAIESEILKTTVQAVTNRGAFSTNKEVDHSLIDVGMGLQYRVLIDRKFTPYGGAGLDIFISGLKGISKKINVGGHLKAGFDIFTIPQIPIINVEGKGIIGGTTGGFANSGFIGTVGLRWYF